MTITARMRFVRRRQRRRQTLAGLAVVAGSCLVGAWGPPSVADWHVPGARSAMARSARQPSSRCGEAAWTILDQKRKTTVFAGKAECTKLQFNGILTSIMRAGTGSLSLQIQYEQASSITCGNGAVSVDLVGFPDPAPGINGNYSAGKGIAAPPGSSCSLSVGSLPSRPGIVSGGLDAVLGRCVVGGGCAKASDWEMVKVQGSFDAYYMGPPDAD